MTDFLFTDTHFGVKGHSMIWWRSQQEFIYKQFVPAIKDYGDNIRVIHLGDVFDSRSGINTLIAAGVRKIFEDIAALDCVTEIIIIAGNHDFYSPVSDEYCTIETILNNIQKTRLVLREIYETVTSAFVPWFIAEQGLDKLPNKIIYTHADITGLSFSKPVYSGHIHWPKLENNSYNLGSCYPLTFADSNSSRGFYIKTPAELRFVPNKYSIQFWRLYNDEIFNNIPFKEHDYIELYIDQENLPRNEYQDKINQLKKTYKNVWIIPQRINFNNHDVEVNMDIESIIESHIPDELKDKFNIIKSTIN